MIREQLDSDSHVISNQISNLINTPIEQNFERLARMSRRLFDVPVIVLGLFDEKRKSIKPVVALDFSDSSIYVPLFNEFNSDDIVRSGLCGAWVKAIEKQFKPKAEVIVSK